jgi:hypothetical protein
MRLDCLGAIWVAEGLPADRVAPYVGGVSVVSGALSTGLFIGCRRAGQGWIRSRSGHQDGRRVVDAIAVVEDEVRELVRRRGIDPAEQPWVVTKRQLPRLGARFQTPTLKTLPTRTTSRLGPTARPAAPSPLREPDGTGSDRSSPGTKRRRRARARRCSSRRRLHRCRT